MDVASVGFVLVSAVLVLMMTPGLAMFYGGLVSHRNAVNTMLMVYIIIGLTGLLWVIVGFGLSFMGNGSFIGNFNWFLHGINLNQLWPGSKISTGTYMIFQMMFAIITPALFVGAVVGRIRFRFLLIFVTLWSLLVYYPMAHIVWSANGFLAKLGTLDFAGGTVIHINAGVTALVLALLLGHRLNYKESIRPYSVPLVLIGTTLLWIGWYGFNAGSALAVSNVAINAVITTTVATVTAIMTWLITDAILHRPVNLTDICTATLCGLVAITPATGFVDVMGAFFIGIIATLASYIFVHFIKPKIQLDDTLDAFGCHGVSGIVGSIATGLFDTKSVNSAIVNNGLFYGGGFRQVGVQLVATCFTIVFAAVMSLILVEIIKRFTPFRVDAQTEKLGLDQSSHHQLVDDSKH